jgi:polynucleotide 5'-triphosphatase
MIRFLVTPDPTKIKSPNHERKKDRISYSHDLWSIDLTTVTQAERHQTSCIYEVEVEFSNLAVLKKQADHLQPGKFLYTSHYYSLIERFLQNVRLLAQKSQPIKRYP